LAERQVTASLEEIARGDGQAAEDLSPLV